MKEERNYYTSCRSGTTPLHLACKYNCIENARFFIEEMGADPNEAKDPKTKRITPLAIAFARGYLELA